MRHTRFKIRTMFFAVFLLALALSAFTSADALDVKRTVSQEGLTVLHVERHNLPIVMITLLVKASPLDETPDRAGLANLTAELLAEGTKRRSAKEISGEIEFIGASLNASADEDFTLVTLSVLKKDIEKGFDVFSDVILNPTFPDEEIRRIKDIIKGSLRQSEEEPSFVASKAFKHAVFGDLPYGRLVAGGVQTIDAITRKDIKEFHSRQYRPNNAVLSIVGDLSPDEVAALMSRYFSGWKSAEIPPRRSFHSRDVKEERILIEKELTQATIVFGHAGISRENPDYYAVSVMNYMLGGGGFSSRLMQRVRDELGLAYDIHSFFSPHKDGGLFEVTVQTKNRSANTVIAEIVKALEHMRTSPVSDQELGDAKAYLTGSFPRRLDTNRKIADFLAVVDFYGLGLDYIEKYPDYINSVTKDDVLKVAQKYIHPDHAVLVVVAKQSEADVDKGGTK